MPDFSRDQIVTVFRSRVRPENSSAYTEHAARMDALVHTMPGLVEHKLFTAADGERVTIVTFADEEYQKTWRTNADHREAQRAGRTDYYEEYSIQVCRTERVSQFTRGE